MLFGNLVLSAFSIVCCTSGHAEESQSVFQAIQTDWAVQAVAELPAYSFYIGAPAVHGVSYQPNFAPRLGLRALWRNWGTLLAFSLPIPESEKSRRGSSRQTNIVLNNYWRQNAMDYYYQKFKGFYVSSPTTELSFHKPGRYPQLPDAQVVNLGINWYHVIDPENYSLKAAFNQTEFQIRSGGSWLYTPFYNHLEMRLGSVLIPGSDPSSLAAIPNLSGGRFDTVGFGMGYGYTFIWKSWFANGQLALSPGLQRQYLQRADGNDSTLFSAALKGNLNSAAGYNGGNTVAGVKFLIDSLYSKVSDTQVWSNLVSVQLFAGGRF